MINQFKILVNKINFLFIPFFIVLFFNQFFLDDNLEVYNDSDACNDSLPHKGRDDITEKIENTEATICIVCQKSFTSNKRMQIHLVKKHFVRNDKNVTMEHKCDKCEKIYTTRANLVIHERSHTGS